MSSSLQVEERQEHNNTRIIAARHTEWGQHNGIIQHIVKNNNEGGANIKTIANIERNIVYGLPTYRHGMGNTVDPAGTTHYIVHTTDGREYQWYVDVLDSVQAPGGQYYFIIEPSPSSTSAASGSAMSSLNKFRHLKF